MPDGYVISCCATCRGRIFTIMGVIRGWGRSIVRKAPPDSVPSKLRAPARAILHARPKDVALGGKGDPTPPANCGTASAPHGKPRRAFPADFPPWLGQRPGRASKQSMSGLVKQPNNSQNVHPQRRLKRRRPCLPDLNARPIRLAGSAGPCSLQASNLDWMGSAGVAGS